MPLSLEAADRLILPPPFTEVRLACAGAVLDEACARGAEPGAGTLVHAARPGALAFAVVLEPETPLAEARLAFYAGMSALVEALAGLCPPERSVRVAWPDTLVYDAARIGGATLVWPAGAAEDEVPDWLVFGAELIADRDGLVDPGRHAGSTSLAEEAIGPAAALIEGFASHLMRNIDTWQVEGFAALAGRYLGRLDATAALQHRLGPGGDLLETSGVRRALVPALAARSWHDPARGGPRL